MLHLCIVSGQLPSERLERLHQLDKISSLKAASGCLASRRASESSHRNYFSFAYSVLACFFRMGISGSASLPEYKPTQPLRLPVFVTALPEPARSGLHR
jgi:hypothetical protein